MHPVRLALRLVDECGITLGDAIAHVTTQPAKILGIDAVTLSVGAAADVIVLNPEQYWSLSRDTMLSHGRNTPFLGWELKGKVPQTLIDGVVVYSAG